VIGADWHLEHRERARWERNTQKNYLSVFRAHVDHASYGIADEPLPTLSDERIARFRDDMDSAGVPANAQSKTLTLVSSLLSAAAEGRSCTGVRQNPMLRGGVKKPRAKRARPVLVFAPVAHGEIKRTKEDEWRYPPLHPVLRAALLRVAQAARGDVE
jgi:hypothetical protein